MNQEVEEFLRTVPQNLMLLSPEERAVAVAHRAAIAAAIQQCALGIDFRQWHLFRDSLADVVLFQLDPTIGPSPDGPIPADEIIAKAKKDFEAYKSTQHFYQTYAVRLLANNEAEALTYCQASHFAPDADGATQYVQKGYYLHRLTLTEAGWKITEWRQYASMGEGNRAILDRALRHG